MTDVYGTHKNVVSEPFRDDLTKIKGIGTTTAEKLYNAKITTVLQIAEITPEKLSETPGIGLATATKFIAAAKNHLESSQREDIAGETTQIQDTVKFESRPEPIEKYEVAEVIVEEIEEISEEPQTEVEEDFENSQANPKWFPDKINYSRLIASYPPISERIKNSNNTIEQEEYVVVESKTKQLHENIEFDTQPEIAQVNKYEEEIKQECSLNNSIHQQISNIFKNAGCYEIPSALTTLKQFTASLDYLGCKLVEISESLKILLLFPVKSFTQEGTVLVDETKLELKSHSKKKDLGAYNEVEQSSQNLLKVRDSMYKDINSNQNILQFFQKYLQITISLGKGFGNKSVVFLSGNTQYKVYIEPIMVCSNPPRSMEKSLAFPYQRSTNLHAVTRTDIAPLVRFLEKKYRMIEKRTKQTSSVRDYKLAEEKFRSNVKYGSIPIFGYSLTLLIVYFAELYFLLRLFNTIGFAVLGIYLTLLAFFYFKMYKTKKEFTDQFETPYYLQNLEFSETDLLDFKEELTNKLLTQFGYECLEKDAKFRAIEQSERNALKHTVEVKQVEPKFKKIDELEQKKDTIVKKLATKYGTKYSSFLEDS